MPFGVLRWCGWQAESHFRIWNYQAATTETNLLVRVTSRKSAARQSAGQPVSGYDTNNDGKIQACELLKYFKTYGMFASGAAVRIVEETCGAQVSWSEVVAKLEKPESEGGMGYPYADFTLSEYGLRELVDSEWDRNGDGKMAPEEAMELVADRTMLMISGAEAWGKHKSMTAEIIDSEVDGGDRQRRVRRDNGEVLDLVGEMADEAVNTWKDYVAEEASKITDIITLKSARYCMKNVADLTKRLLSQIAMLWEQAVEALSSAAEECVAAVANLATGLLTFNVVAIGKGIFGGVECADSVMKLIALKDQLPPLRDMVHEVRDAVQEGAEAVQAWMAYIRNLPSNLASSFCNAATKALDIVSDTFDEFTGSFEALTQTDLDAEPSCENELCKGGYRLARVATAKGESAVCLDMMEDIPDIEQLAGDRWQCPSNCRVADGRQAPHCTKRTGTNPCVVELKDPTDCLDKGLGPARVMECGCSPILSDGIEQVVAEIMQDDDTQFYLSNCTKYQVVRGDTLSHIALAYRRDTELEDVTWEQICDDNNLRSRDVGAKVSGCDYIRPGEILKICSQHITFELVTSEGFDGFTIDPHRAAGRMRRSMIAHNSQPNGRDETPADRRKLRFRREVGRLHTRHFEKKFKKCKRKCRGSSEDTETCSLRCNPRDREVSKTGIQTRESKLAFKQAVKSVYVLQKNKVITQRKLSQDGKMKKAQSAFVEALSLKVNNPGVRLAVNTDDQGRQRRQQNNRDPAQRISATNVLAARQKLDSSSASAVQRKRKRRQQRKTADSNRNRRYFNLKFSVYDIYSTKASAENFCKRNPWDTTPSKYKHQMNCLTDYWGGKVVSPL